MSGPAKTLDGARALRRYLDSVGKSVPVFCEETGLDRIRVQRYLKGERKRATVDFAKAIQDATGGAVPWDSWLLCTLRPSSVRRKRTRKVA
jgi:hypothetical protein